MKPILAVILATMILPILMFFDVIIRVGKEMSSIPFYVWCDIRSTWRIYKTVIKEILE